MHAWVFYYSSNSKKKNYIVWLYLLLPLVCIIYCSCLLLDIFIMLLCTILFYDFFFVLLPLFYDYEWLLLFLKWNRMALKKLLFFWGWMDFYYWKVWALIYEDFFFSGYQPCFVCLIDWKKNYLPSKFKVYLIIFRLNLINLSGVFTILTFFMAIHKYLLEFKIKQTKQSKKIVTDSQSNI